MQVNTEMKRKVRKEPEGGSKKRKEVGNDNSLSSMFAKQQLHPNPHQDWSLVGNYKKRMPSSAGVTRPSRSAQGRSNVYSQLSGLEDMVFNDFIKDDFIPEGDGRVASGSVVAVVK
jgi:hypothetical protein